MACIRVVSAKVARVEVCEPVDLADSVRPSSISGEISIVQRPHHDGMGDKEGFGVVEVNRKLDAPCGPCHAFTAAKGRSDERHDDLAPSCVQS
jgi:hypothetical protein